MLPSPSKNWTKYFKLKISPPIPPFPSKTLEPNWIDRLRSNFHIKSQFHVSFLLIRACNFFSIHNINFSPLFLNELVCNPCGCTGRRLRVVIIFDATIIDEMKNIRDFSNGYACVMIYEYYVMGTQLWLFRISNWLSPSCVAKISSTKIHKKRSSHVNRILNYLALTTGNTHIFGVRIQKLYDPSHE